MTCQSFFFSLTLAHINMFVDSNIYLLSSFISIKLICDFRPKFFFFQEKLLKNTKYNSDVRTQADIT